MTSLRPYRGSSRTLVLGIDVGTTFSGVAYSVLDPGDVPKIRVVTRYPGQENAAGNFKIPSILYYNSDGTVHSVGAEAAAPGVELEALETNLIFVEWFKLHLRPKHLDSDEMKRHPLTPLPPGKSVVDVFADFFKYLFDCARKYIIDTHASGESLWNSVRNTIQFVLSHPNGWEGHQQSLMRQAAIKAKLIPNIESGHNRVHFITEGEASLNFCIESGLADETMKDGKNVMIIDAGGGTIDISSYTCLSTSPVSVEEITSADCLLQGSTRVDVRAEGFLRKRLKDREYGSDEDIKLMIEGFSKSAKTVFKDEQESSYIRFGPMRCNDLEANIRRGQLTLLGEEMASFFLPSLEAIIDAVQKHRQNAHGGGLLTVLLVGGFAANPWLHSKLKERLQPLGLALYRPDAHTDKAVAHGAVCYYLQGFVAARVTQHTYGTDIIVNYEPTNAEHINRAHTKSLLPSGKFSIPNGFSVIIRKGTRVLENDEVSQPYTQEARDSRTLNTVSADIIRYKGKSRDPRWVDVERERFTPLCTVFADTSKVFRHPKRGTNGIYYVQEFDIVLLCGLTEMKAQIRWKDSDGLIARGPAKIVYDSDIQAQ